MDQKKRKISHLFEKNTIGKEEAKPTSEAPEQDKPPASLKRYAKAKSELNSGLKRIWEQSNPQVSKPEPPPRSEELEIQETLKHIERSYQLTSDLGKKVSVKRPLLPLNANESALSFTLSAPKSPKPPRAVEENTPLKPLPPIEPHQNSTKEYSDLYYRYRKLQLHYAVCQILLKVGLALNAQLQEIAHLLVEKFSLWQCHIFLLEGGSDLSCAASFSRREMDFLKVEPAWAVPVGNQNQLQKVLKDRQDIISKQDMYHHYSIPIAHQQEIRGIIDIYFAPSHTLLVEEQITLKTVAAQLSSYLEEYAKYQRAQQMATTDGLTHIYNHRYFQEVLESDLRDAYLKQQWLSLILLDVDHFKKFNDTHGHLAGDKVLQHMAQLIKHNLRPGDFFARYGGEEFVVVLKNTPPEKAREVAENLRKKVLETPLIQADNTQLHMTISLGVAGLLRPDIEQREKLISLADQALYQAKEKGRNQVQMHAMSASTSTVNTGKLVEPAPDNNYKRNQWTHFLRTQEKAIIQEWDVQTSNYDVPEVTNAVYRIKPTLTSIIAILGEYLDKKTERSLRETLQKVHPLPAKLIAEVKKGKLDISLISLEIAIMLMHDAFKATVKRSQLFPEDYEKVMDALSLLIEALNDEVVKLFGKDKG